MKPISRAVLVCSLAARGRNTGGCEGRRWFHHGLLALAALLVTAPDASAQLGPFVWKLDPYCNVITVTAFPESGGYRLSGVDNLCGAAQRAPLTGMVTPNPDGTFAFTFVVRAPDGRAVHTSAALNVATLSGAWRDSGGQTGTLLFAVAAGGGSPRPLPALEGAAESVTSAMIVDGAVGAVDANLAELQRRIIGTCGAGQFVQSVAQDGTVTCGAAVGSGGGDITAVVAGTGLTGGATSGDATLAVNPAQVQARFNAACPAGQFVQSVDQNGTPTCAAPAGDITGVTAGAGLIGGATSGNATLAVNFGSVQARFLGTCGQGSLMSGADGAGNPICTKGGTTGSENVVLGGNGAITGQLNTVLGNRALFAGTAATENTAIGGSALSGATTGNFNTAVGSRALLDGTAGSENVAIGTAALAQNTTGSFNTAVGTRALIDGTAGNENVVVGAFALPSSTGSFNVAIGSRSMVSLTGQENVGVGAFAVGALATGNNNLALGSRALAALTNGSTNVALGQTAGSTLTTGSGNIYIANNGIATESNVLRIGSSNTAAFVAGIFGVTATGGAQVFINNAGQLGTAVSSRRYKQDIEDMGDESRRLFDLRPVTFRYKSRAAESDDTREYGLIAEEVNEIYPDLVVRAPSGEIETVQYHKLTPMLLNELQRQQRTIDELMKRLSETEAALRALTERVTDRVVPR